MQLFLMELSLTQVALLMATMLCLLILILQAIQYRWIILLLTLAHFRLVRLMGIYLVI